jgi:hypothetical protein
MTLEQAEQKILAHVLSDPEGWVVTSKDYIGSVNYTHMRNALLKVVLQRREQQYKGNVQVSISAMTTGDRATTLLTSDKYPDLIEWWDRAEKASAEKRVIDFAETL